MNWQLLITIIVLLGCLAYVVYRLRRTKTIRVAIVKDVP